MASDQPGDQHGGPALKPGWRERLRSHGLPLRNRGKRYLAVLTGPDTPRSKRIRYAAGGAAALFGAIGLLVFLYALVLIPFTPGISEIRKAKVERPSAILSADGVHLATFKPVNREWVPLDEIAPEVVEALVATEDHRFYRHPGVDVWRLFGALYQTLTGNVQGGSTITQQLARNLYPDEIGREMSLTRKLKELITALKIEAVYTKDEILETYLNTVPFLYNAYGIEMAARTYFDESASDLDLLEAATLVGMLKGTYYYNPVHNPQRAQQRRNVVLSQMVKRGELEEGRFQDVKDEPLGLDFERQTGEEARAPHFVEHVRAWLIDWADRNGYNIYRDSLTVHTTLDIQLQEMAQRAVDRWMPPLQAVVDAEWSQETFRVVSHSPDSYRGYRQRSAFDYFWESQPELVEAFIRATLPFQAGIEDGVSEEAMLDSLRADATFMEALRQVKTRLEVGFVAMDPETGYVKAWVGSRNFEEDQYDHAGTARRQPGSTFKPFVYAAALEEGFEPDDTFPDTEVEIELRNGEVWTPVNAGGYSEQEMTLAEGLAYSKNSITAQLIEEVGPGDVARLARRMGVRRSDLEDVPSLALGTSEVTLLEMVNAYSTLASGGLYRSPILVTRIEDRHGNVVAEFEPDPDRVLDEETAWAVVDMMRGVVDRGTGRRIRSTFGIGADVAGKTGTTQDNADGWFILMNPQLVAGAWVGFNDPRVAFRSNYWGQGANNALFIVGDFFQRAIRDTPIPISTSTFPPSPAEDEASDSFLAGVVDWIGATAGNVGSVIGSAIDGLGDLIFGGEVEDMAAPPQERGIEAEPPPEAEGVEEPEFDTSVADSLNRIERESTQLNRVLERLREQRGERVEDAPEAENEDGGEDAETEEGGGSEEDAEPDDAEAPEENDTRGENQPESQNEVSPNSRANP